MSLNLVAGLAEVHVAAATAGRAAEAVTLALFVTMLVSDAEDGGSGGFGPVRHADIRVPLDAVEQIQAFAAKTAEVLAGKLPATSMQGPATWSVESAC